MANNMMNNAKLSNNSKLRFFLLMVALFSILNIVAIIVDTVECCNKEMCGVKEYRYNEWYQGI